MILSNPRFEWEGRTYAAEDFEAEWTVEIRPGERAAALPIIKELVELSLCEIVYVLKTHGGEFFMFWSTRHPELPSRAEMYGDEFRLTAEENKEWIEMHRLLPDSRYFEDITRQEAFELIAAWHLPEEFHADAGL